MVKYFHWKLGKQFLRTDRRMDVPAEVSEKMSADEKRSLRKMILNMDGTNIPFPGFVLVLSRIFDLKLLSRFPL